MRLVIGIIAIAAASVSAQQPSPSFRGGIDLVTVEASVLDAGGRPIADLSPSDFLVTINGRARQVRAARAHHASGLDSVTAVDAAPLTAPVTNARDDGRIVVFVVDRDSIAPGSERAILEAAASLVDGLRAGDAAGVLELPGGSTELTRDLTRVRAAIMRLTGSRPSTMRSRDYSLTWEEALGYERRDPMTIQRVVERECPDARQPAGLRNPCPPELELHATEMLQAGRARTQSVFANLTSLARQLEPLRGSKQIVLLSSGFPFGQDLLPFYDEFARRAAEAQVVVYALQLDQPMTDVSARKTAVSVFGGNDLASGLGNVASMTGGALFMASGSGASLVERVANEIHNFYELAIELSPADVTAGMLDVEVKVNRPGATVRNRRRALAPSNVATAGSDRLNEMLAQPVDVSEVPMALSAYTMRGDEPSTLRTLVGLDAGGAVSTGPAEWGFAVFNDGNLVATGRQRLERAAGPWVAAMSAKLLPGRYRVRAAIVDGAGRTGVVERPLDVGLRGDAQVQFSDLLVGVADANGRLQPSSRVMRGLRLSALVEVIAADPVMLDKIRTLIEIVPGGSATPIKRFMMAAQTGTAGQIVTNSVEMATADLSAGRYTAIATPMLGEQPLGKVTRVFEIVASP